MLALVTLVILGPLGGISASFMNFSVGFFVGGQVLAGLLGSVVTFPYGPEGKHGGNYIQSMAGSTASMCAMGVLVQAMVWLGLPQPPAWQLFAYFLCIGMFGAGLGMLYTPLVVDRMQLAFPSGFAVANILRALTDKDLLKRSIAKLGGGTVVGYAVGVASLRYAAVAATGISASTFGAGLIVGLRIALPALVVALIGHEIQPTLVAHHWLAPGDPYRKIGFIIGLGGILGAAILDISSILIQAARTLREKRPAAADAPDWKRVNRLRLLLWIFFWAAGVLVMGHALLHQPLAYLAAALALSVLFVLVNGISLGISDWNPISSAFVITVILFAALGLHDAGTALMCAAVLLIACSQGGDMQQDRSTGWRLGTNRVIQFRFQMIGVALGAALAIVLAKVFLAAYPILKVDQFVHHGMPGMEHWQSAMTYKFVGALRGITTSQPHLIQALKLGIGLGLAIEVLRKSLKRVPGYRAFASEGLGGRVADFLIDAVFLPSPYASAFGSFVELPAVMWWTAGGAISSFYAGLEARHRASGTTDDLPSDMSSSSLVGGGLIAGDSLAALSMGVIGLLSTLSAGH
ncbi:MAG TPA: OPT/YSL family transporter [Opitutaceae bacterium]|jgi:uncharacterized oligopeptide transporter (OPT) family protein